MQSAGIEEIPMNSYPALLKKLEIPDPLTHSLMGLHQWTVPIWLFEAAKVRSVVFWSLDGDRIPAWDSK